MRKTTILLGISFFCICIIGCEKPAKTKYIKSKVKKTDVQINEIKIDKAKPEKAEVSTIKVGSIKDEIAQFQSDINKAVLEDDEYVGLNVEGKYNKVLEKPILSWDDTEWKNIYNAFNEGIVKSNDVRIFMKIDCKLYNSHIDKEDFLNAVNKIIEIGKNAKIYSQGNDLFRSATEILLKIGELKKARELASYSIKRMESNLGYNQDLYSIAYYHLAKTYKYEQNFDKAQEMINLYKQNRKKVSKQVEFESLLTEIHLYMGKEVPKEKKKIGYKKLIETYNLLDENTPKGCKSVITALYENYKDNEDFKSVLQENTKE